MQKIIYVPPAGDINRPETCVEFSLTPPYIIGSVSGTGGADTTVISSTVPGVDGVFVQGIRTESRQITCFLHVKGDTRAQMYEERFRLAAMLAPAREPGTLYYFNDFRCLRIGAIPTSSPSFTDRFQNYNRAELTFLCPFPHWESLSESAGYMAYLDEGFEFPFEFDVSFAALENQTRMHNLGSVASPVQILIQGPATNPAVVNGTTGEFIRLAAILEKGESIFISTKRGAKEVTIRHQDGSEEDGYHYIDPQSTFFQMAPGENHLRYESDNETEQTQVKITYRELYAGV